jgi:predicted MPP superfamily phosphohydrolase
MMGEYIKNMEERPDLVFWTGDNIAHDIWNQTAHKNAEYTIQITNWIKQYWSDIPVFATPGNHEFYPVNVMSFDGKEEVFEQFSTLWKDWLDEESFETFKNFGFYSIPVRGAKETWDGFNIMVLNTGVCNNKNW